VAIAWEAAGNQVNFAGNFKKIGEIDVEPFKLLVNRLSDDHWLLDKERQAKYEVHRQTQNIGLVYDYDFRHVKPTVRPPFNYFEPALMPIVETVATYYDNTAEGLELVKHFGQGYCVRASLVRLMPGGSIAAHQDKNFSLNHSHRVHIPIITNPKVTFTVGAETRHLREGEIIEINNRRMHSVENASLESRIHLLIDWVIAGESCCCAAAAQRNELCNPQLCMATDRLQIPCNCHPA